MQSMIVAMMRFSAALTLWGMDQVQNTLKAVEGKEKFSKTMDGFESALDSLTEVLVDRMGDKGKDTLKSVTKMSEEVVSRTADQISILSPREMVDAASNLIKKTSEFTTEVVAKTTSAEEKKAAAAEKKEEAAAEKKEAAAEKKEEAAAEKKEAAAEKKEAAAEKKEAAAEKKAAAAEKREAAAAF